MVARLKRPVSWVIIALLLTSVWISKMLPANADFETALKSDSQLDRVWAVPLNTSLGDWKHYHDYTEIVSMLLYLNSTYSEFVDVFSIGKSWQNRDIYCIRLTNESSTNEKPKVLFVGYHHAREVISAELPFYFAVAAASNYGADRTITTVLNRCEIYIVIALNVDGLEIMKTNEWQRKNAHPFDDDGDGLLDENPPSDVDKDGSIEFFMEEGDNCRQWTEGIDTDGDGLIGEDGVGGVDLNRNYGYQWDTPLASSSDSYPSSEVYRGPAPFSEPETQALRDLALRHSFKYAISFHSGSECIIYPWGYTISPTPHDAIFNETARNLATLVNAPYFQGGVGLYTISGEWGDWMYGNRSTLAMTCEIYSNITAWQYTLLNGTISHPKFSCFKGIFQSYNPSPTNIEKVIKRWLPVFTYISDRAINYNVTIKPVPFFEPPMKGYATMMPPELYSALATVLTMVLVSAKHRTHRKTTLPW